MDSSKVIRFYLKRRLRNLRYVFSPQECKVINNAYKGGDNHERISQFNSKHNLPHERLPHDGTVDDFAVELYNLTMGDGYKVSKVGDIKESAEKYIKWYEKNTDKGKTATEIEHLKFVTAFSNSAFGGIRYAETSRAAHDSMVKTINSHNNSTATKRS